MNIVRGALKWNMDRGGLKDFNRLRTSFEEGLDNIFLVNLEGGYIVNMLNIYRSNILVWTSIGWDYTSPHPWREL